MMSFESSDQHDPLGHCRDFALRTVAANMEILGQKRTDTSTPLRSFAICGPTVIAEGLDAPGVPPR